MRIARGITDAGETVWAEVSETDEGISYHRLKSAPSLEGNIVLDEVKLERLFAPAEPPMILCVGLNYWEHLAAIGAAKPKYPVIIPQGINALQDPGATIVLPRFMKSDKIDYEGELAVVIGRDVKNISRESALDYVLGYTCANDVSARDWQFEHGGGQWAHGKNFDTFAPMGPYLVTKETVPGISNLLLTTYVNGEIRQQSSTKQMIFSVSDLIVHLSGSTTLLAGTVILTGTPAGVGWKRTPPSWLAEGDVVKVEIEKIGSLMNVVENEKGPCH
jgi:2-keto-4-pentenoate hydratase/2-oxohepta-3-ene-1,7-dioic acid hydratase in catechol pathway